MNEHTNGVMIALVPMTTDWCRIECPHLTLVYVGEKDELKPTTFNELAKDAASLAMLSGPITLRVMGLEVFGSEEKVDVLRLMPNDELRAMRRFVEDWNASEHSFNSHVTIGPVGSYHSEIPMYLAFDKIMVGWGEDYLTMFLRGRGMS